jgi:signal peptidase I
MRTWFKIVAWFVGVVGAVLLVLYVFLFDVWTVPSDDPLLSASIEPTLSAGDVVIVTRHASITRGNLLRCADPQAPGRFVVARALGGFGDHIELRDETVSIDGHHTPSPRRCDDPTMLIHDPQTGEDALLACSMEEYAEVSFGTLHSSDRPEPPSRALVDAGHWFLVSDDRHVHLDSRDFGPIDASTCQHVVFRLVGAAGFADRKKRLSIIW